MCGGGYLSSGDGAAEGLHEEEGEYRGDYEDFDMANEDDLLEEFLGLPRKHIKVSSGNMI